MRFDLATGQFVDVERNALSPAVIGSDRSLSWGEFRDAAGRWISVARDAGIGPDVPVVIHGHKEAEFLVAIAGCLSLRAPFVPVDEIYPEERLQRIANIVGAPVIYSAAQAAFRKLGYPARPMDEKGLAYVMFTSGSTGEPKGVQIGREGVVALADWMRDCFELGSAPLFMNQAPFSFDLSMYEVFGFLAMGGGILLNSRQQVSDGASYRERLRRHAVTVWVSTPSFAHQQLLSREFDTLHLPDLRTFLFCGEVLPSTLAKRLRTRFPAARILNTYGPTEATVATTWVSIDEHILEARDPLPVGFAKPGSVIRIEQGSGEIVILGEHVMRGYLNSPQLNAEKLFVENGVRGFRTGDLGEIDASGLLFCHGRRDDQIKLNGYRIELLEVDLALQRLPGVAHSAVVPLHREDGSVGRLVAYVTLDKSRGIEAVDILVGWKGELAKRIPQYMVPSELLEVDDLPVSANGKIDRKALERAYLQHAHQA